MLFPWFLVVSALGGPVPDASPSAPLVDDGPGLITGAATAREPWLGSGERVGPIATGDLNPMHAVFFSLAPENASVLRGGRVALALRTSRTNSMEGWKFV